MADLCALLDENVQHNILTIKRLPKFSSFVDFGQFLTFGMAWCGPLEECATIELFIN
jgi:hypothetical protein